MFAAVFAAGFAAGFAAEVAGGVVAETVAGLVTVEELSPVAQNWSRRNASLAS